jgi:hypothetical protein
MTKRLRRSPAQIKRDFREWWPEIHATLPRLPENVALDAANKIARYDPRKAHDKAVAARKRARSLIDKAHALLLTSQLQLLEPTVYALTHARDAIDAIDLGLPRSGGQALKRLRKVDAAGGCYYLLKQYTDEEPSKAKWVEPSRAKWVWFSETMFEIATGEHTDMSKACREWAEKIAVPKRIVLLEWPQ